MSETTGLVTASVTSVWPPTSVTLRGGHRRVEAAQLRQRLRRRGAHGQQHRRQQPARLGAGRRDVVDVDEDGGAAHVLAAERDGIAVGHEQLGAGQVERGDVLADAGRHDDRRVVAGGAGEEPGQEVVGQLAGRQRQAEAYDRFELPEAADDEVAVGRLGLGRLAVAWLTVVDEEGGHGSRRPAGAHVEQEVAHDERLFRSHAHRRGRVQHAVRRGLGGDVPVVARHHHVEVADAERAEPAQGALDRAEPVAREDADGQPVSVQPPHQVLGAFVGRRRVGGVELEPLECERGGVARLAGRQREDPLEDELVGRAADGALDGGEVQGAGVRQRAVEVEEDGTQPERPRGAHAGAAALAVTWRRP